MSFFTTSTFFLPEAMFDAPDGLPGEPIVQSDRTIRVAPLGAIASAAAVALFAFLSVSMATAAPVSLREVSGEAASGETREEVRHENVRRRFCIAGHPVTADLELEHWNYGVVVARIAGTSLFGEAPTFSRALNALSESATEFVVDARTDLGRGARFGGQIRKDWETVSALLGETTRA